MINDWLFLLIIFLTNIVQGITGFAGTVLAMPPGILLQGIDVSKSILNVLGLLASIWIVIISYKFLNKKEFIKIMLLMFIGLVIGDYIYSIIPTPILLKVYAIFIILIAIKGLVIRKEKNINEWILILILIFAGIIHGMFVSGGPLLIIYATKKFKEKSEFRSTVSSVWIILNSYLVYIHYSLGLFTFETSYKLLLSLIPFTFGMIIGNIFHKKMSQQFFLILTYILLIISGIILLI